MGVAQKPRSWPRWVNFTPALVGHFYIGGDSNWLNSATGTEVPVGGVLVLPGWFVDLRQKITFPYIVSAAALPKQLPQFRAGSLELAQIQAIAHQVEQKVRDVAKAG